MASSESKPHFFHPPIFFRDREDEQKREDWILLILNQPIANTALLRTWMKACHYRICADGGANRLFEAMKSEQGSSSESRESAEEYLPDIIHGDLDSLRDDVRDFYAQRGVLISHDEDQESTDFGKSIKKICEYIEHAGSNHPRKSLEDVGKNTQSSSPTPILVLGTLSGRMDQGLGLLSEMIREHWKHPDLKLYLVGDSSFSFLLPGTENVIDFSGESHIEKRSQSYTQTLQLESSQSSKETFIEGIFTEKVGIVPIAGPSVITTRGLEWDVDRWETSMGGKVSTSNHIIENVIRVWTDALVLFTVELGETITR